MRYNLATAAPLATVAKFYLVEGRQAGLKLFKDTDVGDPNYRMIVLMKPHVHQLLFVVLTRTSAGTNGQVYFTSANSRQCR